MPMLFGSNPSKHRGCFVSWSMPTSGARGAVLTLPDTIADAGGRDIPPAHTGSPDYPTVVTNVNITQRENVAFKKCFGGRIYTYSFGQDVGRVMVNFTAFLAEGTEMDSGSAAVGWSNGLGIMLRAYKLSRVSKTLKPATLTFMSQGIKGFVIGFTAQAIDPAHNILGCQFELAAPKVFPNA